jgi:hypothetical protein
MFKLIDQFRRSRSGAVAVEYALLGGWGARHSPSFDRITESGGREGDTHFVAN